VIFARIEVFFETSLFAIHGEKCIIWGRVSLDFRTSPELPFQRDLLYFDLMLKFRTSPFVL